MKNFKRFLIILMLVVPVLTTPVAAKKRFYGRIGAKESVVHHPQSVILGDEAQEPKWETNVFNNVPINDQGITGTCWAFGSTSAMEGNLNKKYSASGNHAISWKNLAYYEWHKSDLSGSADTNDYNETVFDEASYQQGPSSGGGDDPGYGGDDPGYDYPWGNYFNIFSRKSVRTGKNGSGYGWGPDDHNDPYNPDDPYDPNDPGYDDPGYDDPGYDDPGYGGGGQNGGTDCSAHGNNSYYLFLGGFAYSVPILYMEGRCLTDDSGNNTISGDLNQADTIFSQAKNIGSSKDDSYRAKDIYFVKGSSSNKDTIKNMLVTCGAGAISYFVQENQDGSRPAYVNNSKEEVEQYQKEYNMEDITDHTITLVGWDDSISSSKFDNKPAGNGAWICRNSWGTGGTGSDGIDENGYTYISYYDPSIAYADIVFFNGYKKGDDSLDVPLFTDNNYGVESTDSVSAVTDDRSRGIAYKADKDLTVKSLSVMTAEDGASYTLTVFGNPSVEEGQIDTTKQTALLTQELTFQYAGVHVVKLDKTIGIKSGQTAIFMLKPKKQIKTFMSETNDTTYDDDPWQDDYYLGLVHCVSDCSGMSLQEQNTNNKLTAIGDGDIYYRLLSDDGIESGAVTFEGSDFDMSQLRTSTGNSFEFVAGTDKYDVTWTKSVPYTGYAHVLKGTTGKKTGDVEVSLKKNGTDVPLNEYKVIFKNNKNVAGNGKSPVMYIKLKKGHSKEAKKGIKKQPLNFEIRQADLSKDVDFSNCDVLFNKRGDVKKLKGLKDAASGKPGKYKFSKNGVKGDIVVDSINEQRNSIEVTFRGINNCCGTTVQTWEYTDNNDDYRDYY